MPTDGRPPVQLGTSGITDVFANFMVSDFLRDERVEL